MPTGHFQSTELNTLKDMIKDIRLAMMTTLEERVGVHSRPMYTHDMDEDGTMWFFTYEDSNKVRELQRDNRISLAFADDDADTYVTVGGEAQIVKDQQKIDDLWTEELKAYFPTGKDDPQIMLVKVQAHQAEYWDRPGGKMMSLFERAKGALTGKPDQSARNEKLGEEPK